MLIQSLEKAPTVCARVTDNAPVMLAAMRELDELDKYSESAATAKIGCVLHHLSLLFKELITLPVLEQTVQEWEHWTNDTEAGALRSVALRVFATCCTSSASERNLGTYSL